MGVKIEFDLNKEVEKLKNFKKEGTAILVDEVIKDSNYFAPEDEGELQSSAIKASDYENGKVIWDTPYAKRLYYNPQYNFNNGENAPNPDAQGLWFEEAKSQNKDKWIGILEKLKKREF